MIDIEAGIEISEKPNKCENKTCMNPAEIYLGSINAWLCDECFLKVTSRDLKKNFYGRFKDG